MLFENTKQSLSSYHVYPPGTQKILVFDRHDDISAKDHERIRHGCEGSTDYNLTIYLLQATESGKSVIRILTDDTDVFVLLVYWVWKMQLHSAVQMERWNGVVIDINATCLLLGYKCLQLPGMHAISGCDTVSYPFNKSKISALNILKAG